MMKANKCNEGLQGIKGQLAWCGDRDDRGGKGHCNGGIGRGRVALQNKIPFCVKSAKVCNGRGKGGRACKTRFLFANKEYALHLLR